MGQDQDSNTVGGLAMVTGLTASTESFKTLLSFSIAVLGDGDIAVVHSLFEHRD